MSERENIFARIREALTIQTQLHSGPGLPTPMDHRRVLPLVGLTLEEQFGLFTRNAADLRATFKLVNAEAEIRSELLSLAAVEKWKRVASHKSQLAGALANALGLPVLWTDQGYDKQDLEQCDVGITECDALVAQTGTVVVTSRTAGGRALTCLPPHHVVIARRGQLVPDLPTAFTVIKEKHGAKYPSMISFITGPSRTGDIERILVLGAHGPKKLTIFCM